MKKYTHAWLALRAVRLLKDRVGSFHGQRNVRAERLVGFISRFPDTFVRGAWFPDTVVKDNVQGGHTWKYSLDPVNGRTEKRRPPAHNHSLVDVQGSLNRKITLELGISDLPDRCEALSQTIRDATLITNKLPKGDIIAFNDSQLAAFYLMLAHYTADAHVPVHCDARDFYKPSKVHPDVEAHWEKAIKRHYRVSTQSEQFDLDEDGNLQNRNRPDYPGSILDQTETLLAQPWHNQGSTSTKWTALLGTGNNNLWDYLVAVCHVSFHQSLRLFPDPAPAGIDYDTVRVLNEPTFRQRIDAASPKILSDAVNSIALVWLATWERWELLKAEVR